MEEAKLAMLNASQKAVDLVSSLSEQKVPGASSTQNMEQLKESIKLARMDLSKEEESIRGSMNSF